MDANYAETIVFRFIGYNLLGSAVRDASGMLRGLGGVAAGTTSQMSRDLTDAGVAVQGLGTVMMLGGIIISAAMGFAASKAAEFNSQMILLHTQARVATSQLQELGAGVLAMSGEVGFSSQELATALYQIESVGGGSYSTATALAQLQAAAMGAAVGHSDLTQSAAVLASTMAVFPGMLPTQAMGQLDAIVGQGKMTMEELNGAMKTGILATLQSSGIGLADFGGALATMTDYAIPATQAANSLRMAIYLIDAPTGASNKVLKEFGLTTDQATTAGKAWEDALKKAGIRHAQLADDLRKPGGIILALQDLRSHLLQAGLDANGQAEVIYKAFGGGKMGKAVLTLYENIGQGSQAADEKLKALGFTSEEVATLHDRLIQKTAAVNAQTALLGKNFQYIKDNDPALMWKQFTSAVSSLVIALGEAFIPLLVAILRFLTPIIQQITQWVLHNQGLVRTIAVVAVIILAVGGAIFWLVGTIAILAGAWLAISAVGIGATLLPIIGILLAVGIAIALIGWYVVTHWKQIGAFFSALGSEANKLGKQFLEFVNGAGKSIGGFFNALGTWVSNALGAIGRFFVGLGTGIKNAVGGFFSAIGTFFSSALAAITNFAKDFASRPMYYIGFMIGFIVVKFLKLLYDLQQWGDKMAADALVWALGLAMNVISGIQWLAAQIPKWWDAIRNATKDYIIKQAKDLVVGTMNFVMAVINGLQWLVKEVPKWWEAFRKIAKDWVLNQMHDLAQGMENIVDTIINAIQGLPEAAWNIGRSIVTGIWEGIKSLIGWIGKNISDFAGGLAEGAKRAIRSSSPSQLFATQIGMPIVQGIWMGMQTQQPTLRTNFGQMLTSMSGTVNSGSIGMGSGLAVSKPTATPSQKTEILLQQVIAILTQIANDTPQINAFAAQKRTG